MKLKFLSLLFLLSSTVSIGQVTDSLSRKRTQTEAQTFVPIKGTILSASTDEPLENVNIVNLENFKGAITDREGNFEIQASVNDTLYISYLGYKTLRVRVSNDWLRFGDVKIKMTEIGIALEEVVVNDIQLTGYLEIDAKNIPIYNNPRYSISGLNTGYEAGDAQPGGFTKVLNSIFNPADFLYKLFGKNPKQLRKMRQMKEDDKVRALLEKKFDRETLTALLQIERVDIDEILRNCNYSDNFILSANDLQILDAISECYEEYRILKKD